MVLMIFDSGLSLVRFISIFQLIYFYFHEFTVAMLNITQLSSFVLILICHIIIQSGKSVSRLQIALCFEKSSNSQSIGVFGTNCLRVHKCVYMLLVDSFSLFRLYQHQLSHSNSVHQGVQSKSTLNHSQWLTVKDSVWLKLHSSSQVGHLAYFCLIITYYNLIRQLGPVEIH